MFTYFFVFIFAILIFRFRKVRFKFKTFFKKGFIPTRGPFGVYCYCGKEGSGKTYSLVEFLLHNQDLEIYSNVHLNGIKYTYFSGFNELLKLKDKHNCIIVYDEIFTALTRSSRINNEVLSFLSQMRKRNIIFLTTAQEWLEINITLRRYCRYQIYCTMKSLGFCGLLIKSFYDAEHMKWSNDDNEYIAPLIQTTVSKCNLDVSQSYDTFEEIST